MVPATTVRQSGCSAMPKPVCVQVIPKSRDRRAARAAGERGSGVPCSASTRATAESTLARRCSPPPRSAHQGLHADAAADVVGLGRARERAEVDSGGTRPGHRSGRGPRAGPGRAARTRARCDERATMHPYLRAPHENDPIRDRRRFASEKFTAILVSPSRALNPSARGATLRTCVGQAAPSRPQEDSPDG